MNVAEAIDLVALVMERWTTFKPSQGQIQRYAEDIAHLDARQVRAAIDTLSADGRQWAPSSGEVRQRVAVLQLDAPEWGEVRRQLVARQVELARRKSDPFVWECPHGLCDGSGFVERADRTAEDCECRPARLDASRRTDLLHPLVAEWIRAHYATWSEVRRIATEYDSTLEAQLRNRWQGFAARAIAARAYSGVEAADLPALEAAHDEDAPRIAAAHRRGELGRVNFLAALNAGAADD